MLNSIDLNDKGYDELLSEALAQIPLYSEEWTNFNVSDPGITMLENLTAFNALQQEQINNVTDEIRRKLLQLLGIVAEENVPATVLAQVPPHEAELALPINYTLRAGSLDFETTEEIISEKWSMKAIYVGRNSEYTDVTRLLDPKSKSAAYAFFKEPQEETALYCIIEGDPTPGSILRFWAQVPEGDRRVPFDPDSREPSFATTVWQYYSENGWVDMECSDNTHAFLTNGEIILQVGDAPFAFFPETEVYGNAIRCLLRENNYDRAPRLSSLSANLFPLAQQKTNAKCFARSPEDATVRSSLAALGNIFVYCRETEGGDYYAYKEASPGLSNHGRYYKREIYWDGLELNFDLDEFGFCPLKAEDAVLICCCDSEMIYHRDLGPVYGYEEQIITLDLVYDLVPSEFSLLAEIPGENDEPPTYKRIFPNSTDADELCYSVLSAQGQLLLRHPTYGCNYRLYLADCVSTKGKIGNLRPGARLEHLGGYDGTTVEQTFEVPSGGFGGVSFETEEELRQRFFKEMHGVHTAVTAEDYEAVAKSVPGLSIHKVKAVVFPKENLVKFVIKPYNELERPELSPLYLKQISAYLENKRMLTTRIDLVSPVYVCFNIYAKLVIKPNYPDAAEKIEALLRERLDYVTSDVPFGSFVRYGDIYDALYALPCVSKISSLRLVPENKTDLTMVSSDFKLSDMALCYVGDIRLELQPYTGSNS